MHNMEEVEEDKKTGRPWKKVLYGGAQAGYEDNYTDSSFLEEMVTNANVRKRRTWTVMRDAIAVSQHVCVVGVVSAVWKHALDGALGAAALLRLDALLLVVGFAALALTTRMAFSADFLRGHALNFSLFVTGLYVLAPIFQTLTRAISSDSIWASTVCLLLVYLLFHDYTFATRVEEREAADEAGSPLPRKAPDALQGRKQEQRQQQQKPQNRTPSVGITFSANVSLNASIVASVLVASRLPNRLMVFALMLFSLELFLLFPSVAYCMRQRSVNFHLGFCCALIVFTMALIFPISPLAFTLFVIVVVFITVVCPYWLIKIQEYKFEINGPWDEAKLCFDVGD